MSLLNADRDVRMPQMPRIWSGYVGAVPASFDEKLKVVIPDLHPDLTLEEVRWDSVSSADPPNEGDSVLVVFDNNREPWALALWPPQTPGVSTAAPSGPAGGDLSGSYPNPIVARASGVFYFGTLGDTSLFRAGANTLQTNGALVIANNPITSAQPSASAAVIQSYVHGDAQMRFSLNDDGRQNWGPGSGAVDTNLYRNGAGSLRTDGHFNVVNQLVVDLAGGGYKLYFGNAYDTNLYRSAAGKLKTDGALDVGGDLSTLTGDIFSRFGTANQVALAAGRLYFGTALDTSLYRRVATVLGGSSFRSDGDLQANAGTANQVWVGHDGGALAPYIRFGSGAGDTTLYRSAASTLKTDGSFVAAGNILVLLATGDTQPQIVLSRNYYGAGLPGIAFGPGGSTIPDTNLYRAGANQLATDDTFRASGNFTIAAWPGAVGNVAYTSYIGGDNQDRFRIYGDGKLAWGDGNVQDTQLYRSGAGLLYASSNLATGNLQTYGWIIGGTQLYMRNDSSVIYFGANDDGAIARAGAGLIRITTHLYLQGQIYLGTAVDSTAYLYRRAGNIVGTIGSYAQEGAVGGWGYLCYAAGEAQPRAYLRNDGFLLFGPGGSTAMDTWLYRVSAGALQINGTLTLQGRLFSGPAGSGGMWVDGGTSQFVGSLNSTTMGLYNGGWHLQVTTAGQIQLPAVGSGAGLLIGGDTSLYRYGGQQLATVGALLLGAGVGQAGWALSGGGESTRPQVRAGSATPTTDANGYATVNFNTAFPNACVTVVAINGDSEATSQMYLQIRSLGVGSFSVRAMYATGAGAVVSAAVRVNYIAYGY